MLQRYLYKPLDEHLSTLRQMVFLVGPRQIGKTTLSQTLLPVVTSGVNYFNWDLLLHRKVLTTEIFRGHRDLTDPQMKRIVLDEIHKYPRWKNSLKGLFDHYEPKHTHWIITGSASLNVYRKGQDSLLGRCFTYHLCPFTVAEMAPNKVADQKKSLDDFMNIPFEPANKQAEEVFDHLMMFGGFPEPFLKQSSSFLPRWHSSRLERLINQDLATTEHLKNLSLVENLVFLLPERVGSLLSINNLRENLEVHFATVKHWLELLERVFYGLMIRPYSQKLSRLLLKEGKWYLWDWSEITDLSMRFENLVAIHLMKYVLYQNELGLDDLSLHYIRDKEKREVDFVICRRHKPVLLVECKLNDQNPSPHLAYFAERLGIKKAFQLVATKGMTPRSIQKKVVVNILPASAFLKELV